MQPDASAIHNLNFNSWLTSFETKELLREGVNVNTLSAKANKVGVDQKKMTAVKAEAGYLLAVEWKGPIFVVAYSTFYSHDSGCFLVFYTSFSTKMTLSSYLQTFP